LCCLSFSPFSFNHCVVCPLVLFLLTIVLSVLRRFADSLLSLVSSSSSFIQRVTKKMRKLVCILDVVPTFECICCWIYNHINVDQFNILYDLLELKPTMINKKLSFLNGRVSLYCLRMKWISACGKSFNSLTILLIEVSCARY
jgi:hypothetical protein